MSADERHLTASGTHVYVHNPETGGDWECPVDYLEIAQKRGWELAEPPAESFEGLVDAPVAEQPVALPVAPKNSGRKPELGD